MAVLNMVCSYCSKKFHKSPSEIRDFKYHYCSRKCQSEHYKKIKIGNKSDETNVKCDVCGKAFYKRKSKLEKSKNHFCSIDCKNKFITIQANKTLNATCSYCGKKFHRMPSRLKYYKHHYCSYECQQKHFRPRIRNKNLTTIKIPCDYCGKIFERIPSKLKQTKRHYCSKICNNKHQKITMFGKNNHMYKEIKKKPDHNIKCDVCGNTFYRRPAQIKSTEKHFCSHKCKGIAQETRYAGKNNPAYGTLYQMPLKKYGHLLYKGILMRSTWEIKFAMWLDEHQLDWKYEPKSFKCDFGTYNPDFYVYNWQQYVEVKGREFEKSMRKFNYMKFKRPNDFILFGEKELRSLGIL